MMEDCLDSWKECTLEARGGRGGILIVIVGLGFVY